MQRNAKKAASFPIPVLKVQDLPPSLALVVEELNRSAVPQASPFLLHMAGIPGAGKSSLVAPLSKLLAQHYPAIIGFDRIMSALPEYKAEKDPEKAFHLYEKPAREAGYFLIKELIEKRANIIFDHGGASPAHVNLLLYAKQAGYRVIMIHVSAPLDAIKNRFQQRQLQEGRHTPVSYIDERSARIARLLKKYRTIASDFIEVENEDMDVTTRASFFDETVRKIAARF